MMKHRKHPPLIFSGAALATALTFVVSGQASAMIVRRPATVVTRTTVVNTAPPVTTTMLGGTVATNVFTAPAYVPATVYQPALTFGGAVPFYPAGYYASPYYANPYYGNPYYVNPSNALVLPAAVALVDALAGGNPVNGFATGLAATLPMTGYGAYPYAPYAYSAPAYAYANPYSPYPVAYNYADPYGYAPPVNPYVTYPAAYGYGYGYGYAPPVYAYNNGYVNVPALAATYVAGLAFANAFAPPIVMAPTVIGYQPAVQTVSFAPASTVTRSVFVRRTPILTRNALAVRNARLAAVRNARLAALRSNRIVAARSARVIASRNARIVAARNARVIASRNARIVAARNARFAQIRSARFAPARSAAFARPQRAFARPQAGFARRVNAFRGVPARSSAFRPVPRAAGGRKTTR